MPDLRSKVSIENWHWRSGVGNRAIRKKLGYRVMHHSSVAMNNYW